MSIKPHIMIVEGRFYEDISDYLADGAMKALKEAGASYECYPIKGALEIPAVIKMGSKRMGARAFDAYVALGCVIRGETSHYDVVAGESARALTELSIREGLLIGNGILTCETRAQAVERADPARKNKGGFAAEAALELLRARSDIGKRQRS